MMEQHASGNWIQEHQSILTLRTTRCRSVGAFGVTHGASILGPSAEVGIAESKKKTENSSSHTTSKKITKKEYRVL
jgi:hypothetical protein